jgi:tetratricopeptide (TPR) repeat protein
MLPEPQGTRRASLAVMFGDWLGDYLNGRTMYFEAKYQESYDRFQRVFLEIGADRNADRAWNTLLFWHGLAAAQVRKHDEALWDFERILERYLDREAQKRDSTLRVPLRTNEFRYILAYMQQRAGKTQDAIQLYREVLENDIGLFMAHVQLANIYDGARMWDQAVVSRRNAINANPDDPSLILDLGITLAKATRWTEADSALRQAQDANPRDARVPYYLGIVEQQLGKAAEARTAFTRFLGLAPSRYERQIADAKVRLAALQ